MSPPLRTSSLQFALAFVLMLLLPQLPQAQLMSLETDNLRLLYPDPLLSYLAPHAARCFENSLALHRRIFDYSPSEKVTVLLHDGSDFADAGATASPHNAILVGVAPFSYAYETQPANERINLIMSHELVHVLMMDRATGADRFFRKLFMGKIRENADNPLSMLYGYLTTPRRNSPRWYHEGMAVFMETWMAGGLGRAQGAYDEMVFRAMVRDSARFYDPVSLEAEGTKIDFQVGVNSYLYGTRFLSYLAYMYGPEKLVEWVTRTSGTRRYFASQFQRVFGMSVDDAWSDWVAWEHRFQQENLDSIRLYPTTPYRHVSRNALGSVSRAFFDAKTQTIYAAVNYPGQVAHLAGIDLATGHLAKICDIKGAALFYVTSLAFDPASRTLFYTEDNNGYRDLVAVDLNTGKQRQLIENGRVGDLAFCPADSSLWGIRHFNGISTLVRIPYPYEAWNQVYSWPYGKDMYDIDVSADGKYISGSLAEISGRQSLILMGVEGLLAGDVRYTELYDFGNSIPANFVFADDSRFLYGSSYYTGVSNIFRYDLTTDSMDVVTNCESGFFRPIPVWSDSIVVFSYTGKGFMPAIVATAPLEDVSATVYLGQKIAEKYPVVRDWVLDPPATVDLSEVVRDSGTYRALSNIRPHAFYPVVEGYKDYPAFGLRLDLGDPILRHAMDLTVSYTPNALLPKSERWHTGWNHAWRGWTFNFKHNGADFYDLFGPTKKSRKGIVAGLGYTRTLISDRPRSLKYQVNLTGYDNLERLPDYQNVSTVFDRFLSLGFDITYANKNASLGAVDAEKGVGWKLLANNTYVDERIYPQFVNNVDLGVALPISHSAVWLRSSLGYAPGDRTEPLTNFYFGGFGNNWVDRRGEKRYRDYYSFPGVELNDIAGTNFAKAMFEWILPPLRFRKLGSSSLYSSWARLALFTTGVVTNLDSEPDRRTVGNVGAQMDMRFSLLAYYHMTFSVGYATAFERGRRLRDEVMFSLKIL